MSGPGTARRSRWAAVLAGSLATAGTAAPEPVAPVVAASAGRFRGAAPDAAGVVAFKGIRYAAPPLGALRWRSPASPPRAPGIVDAAAFGPACLSAPGPNPNPYDRAIPQAEDCLTLNIWTPGAGARARRPVMVWLHGGGFQFSSSAVPTIDGARLAARGAVVVSLNYRLGIFGFLATRAFDRESGHSGDWGLEDQIAALRWVRANIAAFGGDPRNVTIMGESAGAHAVGMLMTAPPARGLFAKAIVESGATWDDQHGSIATHAEALARGEDVVARFSGRDLRALPAETIRAAGAWDFRSDPTQTAFAPSLDGVTLPRTPMQAFATGAAARVPMLGGWNEAEYIPFQPWALPAPSAQAFYAGAVRVFGSGCTAQVKALYPAEADAQAAAWRLDGDMVIAEQTWEVLARQARYAPTYAYRFDYGSAYLPKAYHTAEVPFVFGTLTPSALAPKATPDAGDRGMSDVMMRYWINFARTGDPNGPGLAPWPTLADGGMVMHLHTTPGAGPNPDLARFRFIAGFRDHGRLPDAWRAFDSPALQYRPAAPCPPGQP